ncbi:MAG: hypothetical protein IJJ69_07450 [Oscillospiraceae bacterium]|nr:hypothetical protein [Oscillospiraceae bacterium]
MAENQDDLQENQAESVQPDTPVSGKKKSPDWKGINTVIFILNIIFPFGLFTLIAVFGIAEKLLLIVIATNLLLGIVYRIYSRINKLQSLLIPLRGIAIASVILFYLPVFVMGNRTQKWLYPVKRYIYTEGVSGYGEVLPKTLPKQCESYFFVTQMAFIAQDYHPSSYLAFYTDTATMQMYADSFGGTKTETQSLEEFNEADREIIISYSPADYPNCPVEIPGHVISMIKPTEDLHGAVIYTRQDTYYHRGLILDYDSGYVIFWT